MRITPRTMTAVPRMSVMVTAKTDSDDRPQQLSVEDDARVPTSQRAKRKLKTREDEPRGATQSGRRYLSASADPTEGEGHKSCETIREAGFSLTDL